jgi:ornithine cyclodeaminase/alanine dehydrogenase-like protein (mu-crystallin family)
MEGGIRSLGVVAIRLKSDVTSWPVINGIHRAQWHAVEPGRYLGLILLFSAVNGELLAIMNDGVIQHLRVAAGAGIAAREMARPDAQVVGILGSGGMAHTHATAYAQVRSLKLFKVYSPTPQHRAAFAEWITETTGVPAQVVDGAEAVVRGADIVAGCTDATGPLVKPEWTQPGMHLTGVSGEIGPEAYPKIDRLVTYRSPSAQHYFTTPPEVRPPSLRGSTPEQAQRFSVIPLRFTLPQVLLGQAKGRESPTEVNLYSSEGTGVQFAASAWAAYSEARKRGLGRELPTDWFLQSIRN